MSYFSSLRTAPAAAASLCLATFAAASVHAQAPHNHTETMAPKAAQSVPTLTYESVFARYLSYRDEKIGSWRDANATVDRIGGWRAYAKEAQQADAPHAAPAAPAVPDKSAKPVEPAKPNPHAGHGAKP